MKVESFYVEITTRKDVSGLVSNLVLSDYQSPDLFTCAIGYDYKQVIYL